MLIVMTGIYDDHSEQEFMDEYDEDYESNSDDSESDRDEGLAQLDGRQLPVLLPGQRTENQLLIDPLAEKLFEFCISLITQQFSQGESPQSPLLYFTAILGIDHKNGGFRRAGNYTTMIAGLLWMSRLLVLEYALLKRNYTMLRWPNREAYQDHFWRMEELRRLHLVKGCMSLASHMMGLLAYGKQAAKAEERGGWIAWDETQETIYIDKIILTIDGFKHFVHAVVGSAHDQLYDALLFGSSQMVIDLNSLKDSMTCKTPGWSFLDEPINRLSDGSAYMLSLVRQAPTFKFFRKSTTISGNPVL